MHGQQNVKIQGLSRPVIGLKYHYCVDYSPYEILSYAFHYKKCVSSSSVLQTKLVSHCQAELQLFGCSKCCPHLQFGYCMLLM